MCTGILFHSLTKSIVWLLCMKRARLLFDTRRVVYSSGFLPRISHTYIIIDINQFYKTSLHRDVKDHCYACSKGTLPCISILVWRTPKKSFGRARKAGGMSPHFRVRVDMDLLLFISVCVFLLYFCPDFISWIVESSLKWHWYYWSECIAARSQNLILQKVV